MNKQIMPNCCGCYLITNFGHTTTNGLNFSGSYKPTIKEVDTYLKLNTNYNKMYVAYINNEQRKMIGKALTMNGFRRTGSQYHPAHNTMIYQYTKITIKKP